MFYKISKSTFFTFIFIIGLTNISSQTVTGRIADEFGDGIQGVNLHLYNSQDTSSTVSDSVGIFSFTIIPTNVKNYQLPIGYSISNNYPNPFNPKTRINISVPKSSKVEINVFNILGEKVNRQSIKNFSKGTNFLDLELNGLPNGVYFARITIDNKYSVVRKMMLIYGSQHLITNSKSYSSTYYSPQGLNKINEIIIDSLVAENKMIGSKTFLGLPNLIDWTNEVVEFTIVRACPKVSAVEYEGIIYNTVQIGDQCWLRENLNVGTMIQGPVVMTDNDITEKYCYWNDEEWCDGKGAFYQWDEAMQYSDVERAQGLCPEGWHIPTYEEFQLLADIVDNKSKAIQSIYSPGIRNPHGTNTSGFSAFFTGYRQNKISNVFDSFGGATFFWSSTEIEFTNAHYLRLIGSRSDLMFGDMTKSFGFCIRCIKD